MLGGLAGSGATAIVQPLDTLKVRQQLAGEGARGARGGSMLSAARGLVRAEGAGALYSGLSAAVLRQCTYTTARMGIFRTLSDWRSAEAHGGGPLPMLEKAGCGLAAGFCGAYVGTPADLTLVRMQADALKPPAQRRGYTNVFNALGRVVKEEGVANLWKGSGPNVLRAMIVNVAHLATYDEAKQRLCRALKRPQSDFGVQFLASSVSGLAICVTSLPVDVVKTRMMNMRPDASGALPYRSPLDCLVKTARVEGVGRLYSGFGSYFWRCAPHAMCTLLFAEMLTSQYRQHVLGEYPDGGGAGAPPARA